MSFTFSAAEFNQVLAEWELISDRLNDHRSTYERLANWADLPPAPDPVSQSFMKNARGALHAANGFGEAAREYVTEFHRKLVSAKKDYLEADEDGAGRFRITLGEDDQS